MNMYAAGIAMLGLLLLKKRSPAPANATAPKLGAPKRPTEIELDPISVDIGPARFITAAPAKPPGAPRTSTRAPKATAKPKPKTSTRPTPPAKPPAPNLQSSTPPPPPAAIAPPKAKAAARQPGEAAKALAAYLSAPNAVRGTKGAPNATVRAAQSDMGGLIADGIYGPQTRARAAALGVQMPRTGLEAARDLVTHFRAGGARGSKSSPSSTVRAAQSDMGGLIADGIYGPQTRARAAAFGVQLP